MKPKEIELAKTNTGKEPKQFVVGRDALAIYVHKQNPIDSISLAELAEIYGEDGKVTTWKDLTSTIAGLPERRDHAGQPAEQLRHLRLFPGGRAGRKARISPRAHLAKRLVRRRGPGLQHSLRDRLQRHGLSHGRGESGRGRERKRRAGRGADARDARWTAAIRSRGRCTSTRWASRPAPCKSSSNGSVRPKGRRSSKSRALFPSAAASGEAAARVTTQPSKRRSNAMSTMPAQKCARANPAGPSPPGRCACCGELAERLIETGDPAVRLERDFLRVRDLLLRVSRRVRRFCSAG